MAMLTIKRHLHLPFQNRRPSLTLIMACWSYFAVVVPSTITKVMATPDDPARTQLDRQWRRVRVARQRHKISSPNRRSHCLVGSCGLGLANNCKYLLSNSPPRAETCQKFVEDSSVRHRAEEPRVMCGEVPLVFLHESGVGVFEWLLTEKRARKHQLSRLTNLATGLIVVIVTAIVVFPGISLKRWTKRITQLTQLGDNWTVWMVTELRLF